MLFAAWNRRDGRHGQYGSGEDEKYDATANECHLETEENTVRMSTCGWFPPLLSCLELMIKLGLERRKREGVKYLEVCERLNRPSG